MCFVFSPPNLTKVNEGGDEKQKYSLVWPYEGFSKPFKEFNMPPGFCQLGHSSAVVTYFTHWKHPASDWIASLSSVVMTNAAHLIAAANTCGLSLFYR